MSLLNAEMDFGLELVRQAPPAESCVMSPISVLLALSMVQAGSKGNTRTQINDAIAIGESGDAIFNHFSGLSAELAKNDEGVDTKVANGFFIDNKFELEGKYKKLVEDSFGANVAAIDYGDEQGSAKIINDFVYNNTAGKIANLVTAENLKDTAAMLVNAIYFHGAWQDKFPKKATRKEDFFSAEGKTIKLDFMRTEASRDYAEDDTIQVLSLKYTNPAYTMNIFLPKRGFELGEILAEIDGERIQSLLSKLRKITLTIMIPKMKLETEVDLQEPLTSMGITDLFSPNADLTGITKSGSLSVTHATHKAIIEMDEESTTGAAATQLGFGYKVAYKGFVADRPFLFVLTKSGHPLFMGKFT